MGWSLETRATRNPLGKTQATESKCLDFFFQVEKLFFRHIHQYILSSLFSIGNMHVCAWLPWDTVQSKEHRGVTVDGVWLPMCQLYPQGSAIKNYNQKLKFSSLVFSEFTLKYYIK